MMIIYIPITYDEENGSLNRKIIMYLQNNPCPS